ncbi:MAG: hypothetical protein GXO47_03985 [Chlorobi bacterium]|nr:hypothetical protein [Chlorobiota bacterium]
MKIYTFILSIFLLFTFTNCSEDSVEEDIVGSGKITLTVNGETKEYNDVTASVLGDKIVVGANMDGRDIGFIMDTNVAEGTYNETFGISYGIDGDAVFSYGLNVTACTFTITKHDTGKNILTGTFTLSYTDFNTEEAIGVTGSFDIVYTTMLSY